MEAMKMNLFAVLIVMIMAFSAIESASAAEAPAPSPTSDATAFIPTFIASIVALAFGFFF
ncbi:arabinogalactan protein 13-like [Euphorbia lathyris]|uniref:arabinogalactan protein 13-like n=1 Tax=Euphorbia lathyris TaxID=212925 RepID=UPI003313E39C